MLNDFWYFVVSNADICWELTDFNKGCFVGRSLLVIYHRDKQHKGSCIVTKDRMFLLEGIRGLDNRKLSFLGRAVIVLGVDVTFSRNAYMECAGEGLYGKEMIL